MRYLCIHCDERFELAAEAEVRCPRCLRVHGIRPLGAAPAASAAGWRRRVPLLAASALALAVCAGGAYALWKRELKPDPALLASRPLGARLLARELARRNVQAGALTALLEPDAAVERFARQAAAGHAGAADKARAIVNALHARATHQAF